MSRAASKKRSVPFPFDLLVLLVRPNNTPEISCMFCQQEAAYVLDHFIRDVGLGQGSDRKLELGGLLDIDAMWREAIHRQVEGDYTPTYYQVVCLDCAVHFAAIQLGRRRPIQYLLKMASIVQRQKGQDLSVAVLCTVDSWQDEGDTWAIPAPSTNASAVMQHVNSLGRDVAKTEEPEPKESEDDWLQRMHKRQRLLELRAQEIQARKQLGLVLAAYEDVERKEQRLGKIQRFIWRFIYGLFRGLLDTPESEKLSALIQTLTTQIKEFQAETQVLATELGIAQVQAQDGANEQKEKGPEQG